MEELLKICKTMLDNANLDIVIEWPPVSNPNCAVILDFVVGVSLENIIIRCGKYSSLQVSKDADSEQGFFVGETNIELIPSKTKIVDSYIEDGRRITCEKDAPPMFHVHCDGAITLDIVCGDLSWKIDDGEFRTIPTS
jgi:hypothetical protein